MTARIVATYPVFNHTFDEPAHLATGMEWLDRGTYTWEPQHPPLARAIENRIEPVVERIAKTLADAGDDPLRQGRRRQCRGAKNSKQGRGDRAQDGFPSQAGLPMDETSDMVRSIHGRRQER